MAYIGRTPTNAALTAADLADGIVSTAKIAADAVTDAKIADDVVGTEHLTANEVDTAALKGDAVTGAELADNAVNSEHYTDGSIDNAHIADDAIDSEHYAAGSIDTAHIADGQITTAKLAGAVFTGATDIGAAIVDADLFLMDDGAGGTIRKTTAARLKTYAGGGNTPQFSARSSTNQTLSNNTLTKVVFGTEIFDPQSTFASSRFTPGVAGNYFMTASVRFANESTYEPVLRPYFNGSGLYWVTGTITAQDQYMNVSFSFAITMDADDYVEIYARQNSGTNVSVHGGSDVGTVFNGFKIT